MSLHLRTVASIALVAAATTVAVVCAACGPVPAAPTPVPAVVPVNAEESGMTSSFSVIDAQPTTAKPTITSPKRVYDGGQRPPGTYARLQEHGRDFDPAPPPYILAQGITRVKGAGKRVALTFDDGPSDNTKAVLRILSRYEVHATFFMPARRVEARTADASAVIGQGSEVGNHTYWHRELWHLSERAEEETITFADDAYYRCLGVRPKYVRPKGGVVDQAGIDAIKALGKTYVYWDVAGYDTVPEFTAKDIEANVLEGVRAGSVILLHETNPYTVEALPGIIEKLRRRGYKIQDLTELLR